MFDLSKVGYYADFALAPAYVVALAAVQHATGEGFAAWLALVPAGMLIWSLAEYWVHRLAFHGAGRFADDHRVHHVLPAQYIGVAPQYTAMIAAAIFAALWAATDVTIAAGLLAGMIAGYVAYMVVHDIYHHRRVARGALLWGQMRRHDLHHKGIDANYGVSSPIWDFVFGTYAPVPTGPAR